MTEYRIDFGSFADLVTHVLRELHDSVRSGREEIISAKMVNNSTIAVLTKERR